MITSLVSSKQPATSPRTNVSLSKILSMKWEIGALCFSRLSALASMLPGQ